MIFTRRKCK